MHLSTKISKKSQETLVEIFLVSLNYRSEQRSSGAGQCTIGLSQYGDMVSCSVQRVEFELSDDCQREKTRRCRGPKIVNATGIARRAIDLVRDSYCRCTNTVRFAGKLQELKLRLPGGLKLNDAYLSIISTRNDREAATAC